MLHTYNYFFWNYVICSGLFRYQLCKKQARHRKKGVFVCALFYFHHCNGGSRIKRKRGEGERLFALLQLLRSQHLSFSLQHSLQRKYTNLLHINCTLTLHLLKYSVLIKFLIVCLCLMNACPTILCRVNHQLDGLRQDKAFRSAPLGSF